MITNTITTAILANNIRHMITVTHIPHHKRQWIMDTLMRCMKESVGIEENKSKLQTAHSILIFPLTTDYKQHMDSPGQYITRPQVKKRKYSVRAVRFKPSVL